MTTQATTYNFPNIVKVQFKAQGASAWQTLDKPDNKQINLHAALGDQVLVIYKAHGIENKGMINPPVRKSSVSKYDHKVGSFAWNNLSVNDIRTHTPGKSSRKLTVHIQAIAGHNLAAKLAELYNDGNGIKAAVVNGAAILDSAALKKFADYVNGTSAPKIDKTPVNKEGNVIKEYTLADMQIATYDATKTDENKYGYARFTFANKVWFTDATKDACVAQFGKAPFWHRGANCYILPVADFNAEDQLQAALNLSATLDNTPAQAIESKPQVQAAVVAPAPVASNPSPEMIAAIVAQVMAAMQVAK